jgi:hypothetical protein
VGDLRLKRRDARILGEHRAEGGDRVGVHGFSLGSGLKGTPYSTTDHPAATKKGANTSMWQNG